MGKYYRENNQITPAVMYSETHPEGYSEIIGEELTALLLSKEVELITKRKEDGVASYQSTLAEMRLSRLANNIPHDIYTEMVYIPMDSIISSINAGSWINAYEFIEDLVPNQILTLELINSFRIKLSKYIVFSGNYPEFSGKAIDINGYIL